jgi:hypothetical protein
MVSRAGARISMFQWLYNSWQSSNRLALCRHMKHDYNALSIARDMWLWLENELQPHLQDSRSRCRRCGCHVGDSPESARAESCAGVPELRVV